MQKTSVAYFEGIGNCYYEDVGFRCPNQGEFYLSGANIMAYRAVNDLSNCYHVVKPTFYALPVRAWKHGEEIKIGELL